MYCQRFLGVCLSSAVLCLATQPEAAAQTTSSEDTSNHQTLLSAAPLGIPSPIVSPPELLPAPELPPIQPILPETSIPEIEVVLKLSERTVYVYRGDEIQATYPVAIGRRGWETPTGRFQVMSLLENPGWTNPLTGQISPPGPNNPLGERWIAFWTDGRDYIGFHGTPNRNSVGRAASHGCVRMFNEHVRELYKMVRLGTSVTVEP
ncbi:MAG: L,D-transpeptidase [Cyanothece sp. SIO1E1]|nr:L,D-transpeptidase [Cyanothece sp. SIO1E1]